MAYICLDWFVGALCSEFQCNYTSLSPRNRRNIMLVKIVILVAAHYLGIITQEKGILQADMTFIAVCAVAYVIMSLIAYCKAFHYINKDERLAKFFEMVLSILFIYFVVAAIALVISKFFNKDFWFMCRIMSGIAFFIMNTTFHTETRESVTIVINDKDSEYKKLEDYTSFEELFSDMFK